ncbi:hypothetical protein Fmac_024172 [Flemingia macrophylla]|uniref:CRM domain-containing protein n=1 Tax=Flemingia macrophylla TaxID=520843 RepID=A0ABD1LNM9_9FABA
MALMPTRHLHPFFDSFHTSPNFFRHSLSLPPNSTFLAAKTPTFRCNPRNSFSTWLKWWSHPTPSPKPPRALLDYSENGHASKSGFSSSDEDADANTRGSTMDRIVEKLKKFGYVDDRVENKGGPAKESVIEKGSVEDIFYVEEGMLPNARGGFSRESPLGLGDYDGEVRFPWEKPVVEELEERKSERGKSRTSLAELTLPESELKRLLRLTFEKKHKTRIGRSGVTQAVVDKIHERWKTSEIVRLKFEGEAALNMKRMHEILERKTGGLVIWRSGNSVSLYRGVSYDVPSVKQNKQIYRKSENTSKILSAPSDNTVENPSDTASNAATNAPLATLESTHDKKEKDYLPKVNYEHEVDKLLDSLGPRYTDWPGCDPLPVDADLLPATVPGYQPPFRVLPFGVKSTLGLREATALRRIARSLPPHFALGRNRQLQGLAEAMIKLWEISSIAKVALKRGVQLTTSERMAEEIKKLTGGMLLSRNKDFLVFFRGKNFLSPDVTQALLEREKMAKVMQDEEEQARLRAASLLISTNNTSELSVEAGTLGETLDADAKWGKTLDERHKQKIMREVEQLRHANLVKKLEHKLSFAERKLMRAEKALMKVEESLKPSEYKADPESITDEERFMFRKLGLRMKAFLLLGRRGVFDGTIENMHLHWKYRELVKIIVKAKNFEQVKKIALALEAESGGVLVSVDKVSKGYSIIVYRGKEYQRPSSLRPRNLLTKRKALARSIELQRHEALMNHISTLQSKVVKLRSEIEQMEKVEDNGDEDLYDKLDSTYPSDDENSEVEDGEVGDEAYLETYNSENDSEDESEVESDNMYSQPKEFASRS